MGIWVGRYAMVQGQVREHGPWLVDQRRESGDGSTIRLLILAEPVDDRSAEFCGEVAEAVAALFGREALSVTGGLLRALQQAHANLAEWNERSLREHQVAVGLTCVAIRDGEMTIAQLGAGVVYLVEGDDARRIGTEGLPAVAPLGGPDPIEPRFTMARLADEHILLVSSAAERGIGADEVLESLTVGPERSLAELFTRTRDVPDMAAVLIADLEIEEDTPPLGEPEELLPLVEVPPLDSGPLTSEAAATAKTPWTERRRAPTMPSVRRVSPGGRRTTVGFAPASSRPPRWAWIGGAITALVAGVLLGWLVLPGLLEQDGANRLEDALIAAQLQVDAAAIAESPDIERQSLLIALGELERGRTVDAEDPRLLALETTILAQLALLGAIVEVQSLRPVLRFAGTVTTPLEPASITFGAGFLWLVDGAQGRVFRVDPEAAFDPIEVYSAATLYRGQIAAVRCMPPGTRRRTAC